MAEKLPYVLSYGVITKAFEKIKSAATPERFTQDFLSTKLAIKGGSAKPVIPFLKRIGFLGSDGGPTDSYKRFRNSANTGTAAFEGLKQGFKPLYDRNEYAHELNDKDLKGLVVEATGFEPNGSAVKAIIGSFKALKSFAKFEVETPSEEPEELGEQEDYEDASKPETPPSRIGLSYTINLNLPSTSDIAVFNAIFKSLREHLLR